MEERKKTIIIGLVSLIGSLLLIIGGAIGISAIVKRVKQDNCEHVWKSKVIVAQACGVKGETLFICKECELEKTEETPALEHKYTVEVEAKLATCTEDGYCSHMKCELCGGANEAYKVELKKGHLLADMADVEATCTTAGSTGGVICIREVNGEKCGHIHKKPTTVPAKGHIKKYVRGYAATCAQEGLTDGVVCNRCGEIYEHQQTIPKLAHDIDPTTGECKNCGAETPIEAVTLSEERIYF